MYIARQPLAEIAADLRSGKVDLLDYVTRTLDRLDQVEGVLQTLVPEPGRRERLRAQAEELRACYPDPAARPRLYGVLVGVKDIFHVTGLPTFAGSRLPAEVLAGSEAASVQALREAGALILGKTVTTEFAYFDPGPTRNPHHLEHTPGGSSSGSAAAVAAGLCPLAIGSQTIGSVIRPAAFCGVIGFKPTYGRIDKAGMILFSPTFDHVGLFAQDVAGIGLAASVLIPDWQQSAQDHRRPILGVPDGAYLARASAEARTAFESAVEQLTMSGYTVRRIPGLFEAIDDLDERHRTLSAAEAAAVHAPWFGQYEALYRPKMVDVIRQGQAITEATLTEIRGAQARLKEEVAERMAENSIDLWICPSATGPAPEGLGSTGDPVMNLPWTHTGMPALTLPSGRASNGLPLGLQLVAARGADEQLLTWAESMARIFCQ